MDPILQIEHLEKNFGGIVAVRDLSFSVAAGEILGLIGPNGAGKTTVFNLIMGIYRPDRGDIRFQGRSIVGWPTYRIVNAGIARVFQIAQPLPHQTVYENVELSTLPNALLSLRRPDRERCLHSCRITGLWPDLNKRPGALPQAGLRRLEIAKAIATDPKLLLLDEPFAGLTAQEIEELSELVRDLRAQGRTIVLVDHNMRGVMRLVNRVVVMHFGTKLAEGTPAEVVRDPAVQEAYLAGGSDV